MRERLEGVESAQLRSGNTAGGEPQVPVAPTVQAAIRSERVHEQPAAQLRLESSRGRSHPFHRSARSVKLLISLERGIRLDRTRRTTRHPDPTPGLLVDCGPAHFPCPLSVPNSSWRRARPWRGRSGPTARTRHSLVRSSSGQPRGPPRSSRHGTERSDVCSTSRSSRYETIRKLPQPQAGSRTRSRHTWRSISWHFARSPLEPILTMSWGLTEGRVVRPDGGRLARAGARRWYDGLRGLWQTPGSLEPL